MTPDPLAVAVAAAIVSAEQHHRELLQSVVEVARAIFGAQAGSIFLLDEHTGELVFEAVSGQGEGHLVGRRFPASQGIAGWVVQARQPLVVDDVDQDAHFARDVAEATEYVPRTLMAAPLLHGDQVLGVLEVLDRDPELRTPLAGLDLLSLFATQAAVALLMVQRGREAARLLDDRGPPKAAKTAEHDPNVPPYAQILGLVRALEGPDDAHRASGRRLVTAMHELLTPVNGRSAPPWG